MEEYSTIKKSLSINSQIVVLVVITYYISIITITASAYLMEVPLLMNANAAYWAIIFFGVWPIIIGKVAFAFSNHITVPILHLADIAKEIRKGNFDVNMVALNRGDEIGELAHAVDCLCVSIKIAIIKLSRKG